MMRTHLISFILLLISICPSAAQKSFLLQGKVVDESANSPLSGAVILIDRGSKSAETNKNGSFSLQLSPGTHLVQINADKYNERVVQVRMLRDTSLYIKLSANIELQSVTVAAKKQESQATSNANGTISITKMTMDRLPNAGGEKDVLRAVQLLPGVQSGNEGTRGIFVRGGSPDQSLILLDGAPVYNASHLYGFFSVINGDAIKDLDLYKNQYPSRFGGRLASVIDIHNNYGSLEKWKASISLGFVTSRLNVEGPIWKGHTSINLSVRGCYTGLYSGPISKMQFKKAGVDGVLTYDFFDINFAIKHRFSEKDEIEASMFNSLDLFHLKRNKTAHYDPYKEIDNNDAKVNWRNSSATASWNHHFKNGMSTKQSFIFSEYSLTTTESVRHEEFTNNVSNYSSRSKYSNVNYIRDIGFRSDWYKQIGEKQLLRFGLSVIHRGFQVGKGKYYIDDKYGTTDTTYGADELKSWDNSLYLEDEIKPVKFFTLNVGLHLNQYYYQLHHYFSLQPRVNTIVTLPKGFNLRASVVSSSQNIHLLASSRGDIVNDMWIPATNTLKPESGWQVSGGIEQNLNKNFTWSIDAYYRHMNNLVEYNESGVNVLFGRNWEKQVTGKGTGRAYGAEFFISGKVGNFSAWAKYNLGWSRRQFSTLNNGFEFPYKYDRRHDFAIVLMYKINSHWDISLDWIYGSGNRITLQNSQYATSYTLALYEYYATNNLNIDNRFTGMASNYVDRNNYRLPAFHHLDIGVNYHKQRKKTEHQINISVYNLYNRFNVFSVYQDFKLYPDGTYRTEYKKISLFPLLPSFTYTIQFGHE